LVTRGFCTRRVRARVHFCTRDLNLNPTRAEPDLGAGFIFHPWVHPKPEKNRNLKETRKKTRKKQKNPRNPKKLEKTQNPKQTQKIPERNPKKPKKTQKETHLQNPTDTRTLPEIRRVQVPNFTRGFGCQI
jgi:hypothetical protein